jgi:chitin synthase
MYEIFNAFEADPRVAGVAVEVKPLNSFDCNPLVSYQAFDYKLSHILDMTSESVTGFIKALPQAFSAFRYDALHGEPLNEYFRSLKKKSKIDSPFSSYFYASEDLILGYELFAKKKGDHILKYAHKAEVRVNVPTNIVNLMKQRKYNNNGSLFSLIYILMGWPRLVFSSGHSILKKLLISFQFLYYLISIIMQWTAISHFFIMFRFLIQSNIQYEFAEALKAVFVFFVLLQVVLGLGNRPEHVLWAHILSSVVFGCFSVSIVIIIFPFIFQDEFDWIGILSLVLMLVFLILLALFYRTIFLLLA